MKSFRLALTFALAFAVVVATPWQSPLAAQAPQHRRRRCQRGSIHGCS